MQWLFPSPIHQLQRGVRRKRRRGGSAGTGLFNADSPGALSSLNSLHHHNRGFIISNGLPSRLLFSLAFPPAQTPLVPFFHLIYGGGKKNQFVKINTRAPLPRRPSQFGFCACFCCFFSRGLIAFTSHPSIPLRRHSSLLLGALICSPALDGGIRKSSFCSIPC